MVSENSARVHWASRFGFVLAAAGSAVGLGNIWKFPYITGKNGGGAFVLVYLACVLFVGLPIMIAELFVGRRGQRDAVGAFTAIEGEKSLWRLVGWGGVVASFILLSFYAVVGGWCFDYVVKSVTGALSGRNPEEVGAIFGDLVSSPAPILFWQALFILATAAIVAGGIRGGIERWSKILMPVLFALLLLLFFRGILSPGAGDAFDFMFRPDFEKLDAKALLDALGHSFFTLSLGAGVMITYGSYLDNEADLLSLSLRITIFDTLIALLAGLAIFPVVFAAGLEPGSGPGLVFQTIPTVFSALPFGSFLAFLFFLLLSFAALSSSISMLEVPVAYLVDERGFGRGKTTVLLAVAAFVLGIPSALSFNRWGDVTIFFGKNFFDFCDLLVSSFLLPLGGLFVAIYVGWFLKEEDKEDISVTGHPSLIVIFWRFLVRYVAPVAVSIILLNGCGLLG